MAAQELWKAVRTSGFASEGGGQKTDTETREAVSMAAALHSILAQ